MVNLNFNFKNQQLQIDLTTLPDGCSAIILNLPDGQHLAHYLTGMVVADSVVNLETLPELIRDFVEYLDIYEDRTENTLKGYRKRLKQFTDWLRSNPEQHPADPAAWVAYYTSLKRRPLSNYTRKGHYHILNRFAKWLVEKGYLWPHPLTEISPPKLPKEHEPKAIFREHIRLMLTATNDVRDRAILLFFRDTGCQAAEALSLTWGDLHLDEGNAKVTGKRGKERKLFLKAVTRRALKAYRETVPHKKTDPVWWAKNGPLSYDGLYKIFKRLAEKVDLGDEAFNPHAWRHAFGRDTTKAGIPTAQLQDLLGHSSIEVTKIYAQFNDSELQEAHHRYSPVDEDIDVSSPVDPDSDEKSGKR